MMKITRAIVRHIDDSLAKYALRHEAKSVVDLERARKQHESYVSILRDRCNLSVTYLPSSGLSDSVFIEDTAVIASERGLITRPGAKSRLEETKEVAGQPPRPPINHDTQIIIIISFTLKLKRLNGYYK